MKITMLGTGAAEAIPDPYCRCRVCQTARREGGAEMRARASALVNDNLLIDLGPDIIMSANHQGLYLGGLKVLLVTHRHEDHWLIQNLYWRREGFTPTPVAPLAIYGPADALSDLPPEADEGAYLSRHPVQAGDQWDIADYRITAIPATHGGGELEPLLYVIEERGYRFFYATDTAPLQEAAWELLRPHAPLDLIVLDSTSGRGSGGSAHHGMAQFLETRARLIEEGLLVRDRTQLVAHHFSHNGHLTHRELVEAYGVHDVAVAYDGLVLGSK